jgi:rSAM/selenodomain-associated transferase 1
VPDSFVVFAKEPVAGQVKTRLTPPFPAEVAAQLYEAFVDDVCATVEGASAKNDRRVLAAPAPGPKLAAIAKRHVFETAVQEGPDLGARMAHALGAELARGARSVVLVGSDSPTLPAKELANAAKLAASYDAVIGPAGDGGYWLIACSKRVPDLFDGIPWSTRDVLAATLARAKARKVRLALLPFWYDVDTAEDVRLLAAHAAHIDAAPQTRQALQKLAI